MTDVDETINNFRERLETMNAQQGHQAQKLGLFSGVARPDALRALQGDITRLLAQAKQQQGVFELTAKQLADLTELRTQVQAMMPEVSPSTVKKSWTEVRKQVESSPQPVSAQSVFRQWAEEKRAAVGHDKKSDSPGPSKAK